MLLDHRTQKLNPMSWERRVSQNAIKGGLNYTQNNPSYIFNPVVLRGTEDNNAYIIPVTSFSDENQKTGIFVVDFLCCSFQEASPPNKATTTTIS